MARAIIHNSNYKTADDAKAAIDRYFRERNEHFKQHPRRAGNKIWGKERVPVAFSQSNNCTDPRLGRCTLVRLVRRAQRAAQFRSSGRSRRSR